jgi:hypothetical protein
MNRPFKVGHGAGAVPRDALINLGKVANVALGVPNSTMVQRLKSVIKVAL